MPKREHFNEIDELSVRETAFADVFPQGFLSQRLCLPLAPVNASESDAPFALDVPLVFKNRYEEGAPVNPQFVLQLLDAMEGYSDWEERLSQEKVKVHGRRGSPLNEELSLIRSELQFDPYITLGEILDGLYNFECRLAWDTNLLDGVELVRATESLQVLHTTNKKILFISSRDFVEKRLAFAHDGKFIVYYSACPDSIRPPVDDVVRGEQVLGLHVYEKVGESVRQTGYSQVDIRLPVGGQIAEKALPGQLRTWFDKFRNYLEERKV